MTIRHAFEALRELFKVDLNQTTRRPARRSGLVAACVQSLEPRVCLSAVTTLADAGVGSLRDAIANTPSGGAITFQAGLTGSIHLTSGELVIDHSLNIVGAGAAAITIDAGHASRVFDVTNSLANVSISGLTITNGAATVANGTTGFGGGIHNTGTLSLANCVLSNDFGTYGGGGLDTFGDLTVTGTTFSGDTTDPTTGSGGGGIENEGRTVSVSGCTFTSNVSQQGGGIINNSGTLTVDSSTFSGNHAGVGGGVFSVFSTATTTITRSTIAGNFADTNAGYAGGGICNNLGQMTVDSCTISGNSAGTATIGGGGGGIYEQDGHLTVINSTLYGNNAAQGGGIDNRTGTGTPVTTIDNSTIYGNSSTLGGGVANVSGTVNAHDTIIAGNTSAGSNDFYGTVTSQGHNLIGLGVGGSGYAATDLVGTTTAIDPKLGPLQNNGGPTQTLALLAGSVAIDAGDNTGAPAYDQRGVGYARIVNGAIDIGAYETQTPLIAITPTAAVNQVTIPYGTALANSQLSGTATAVVGGQTVNVAGTFSYTTAASTILNAGPNQIEQVTFTPTDTATYQTVSTSVVVNVTQAIPTFSNLSSPTITAGQASTAISGTLKSGLLIPAGDTISITLNGVTQTAIVDASGNFTTNFATASLTAAGSPYTITFAFARDNANFAASATASSTLTVNLAITATAVTLNPQSQTAAVGSNVTFTATASGNPTPTVQWQISTDGGKTFSDIAGATNALLTLTTVTAAQTNSEYRAVFTNSAGSATTTAATLTVTTGNGLTTQGPKDVKTTADEDVSFKATCSDPKATVQWQVSTDGGKTFRNIVGAKSRVLSFTAQLGQNGYQYRAVFTSSHGVATTRASLLTVLADT